MPRVWLLQVDTKNYKYLGTRNERVDIIPILDGSSRLDDWKPLNVRFDPYDFDNEKNIPNFISLSGFPVCDSKTKVIIQEVVGSSIEFLPLVYYTDEDTINTETIYYIINPVEIVDCLDHNNSEFQYLKSGTISKILKYSFEPDCTNNTTIFKLKEQRRSGIYVNDDFKQIVEENNLTGLKFKKVWAN